MRRLLRLFWIVVALLFLAEAWLWDHLEPIVARAVDFIPWGKLKRRMAQLTADLPPWAALIVFIIPLLVLLPLKFLEVYLLAARNWPGVAAVLILAKLLGVGVTAFVFDVMRDKLLQLAWFRRMFDWFMWLRDWAHAQTEPIRQRIRRLIWLASQHRVARFGRRLMRLRRRAYRSRPA